VWASSGFISQSHVELTEISADVYISML
jgi:hypothetical protein